MPRWPTIGILTITFACASEPVPPPVIPLPAAYDAAPGAFAFATELRDVDVMLSHPDDPALRTVADALAGWIHDATGDSVHVFDTPYDGSVTRAIALVLSDRVPEPEGYRLQVGTDEITIEGSTPAGVWYGAQTLRQLLPRDGATTIPGLTIRDAPRFAYRGMHLDVGRHFFPVDVVKRYIDRIAMYKMNTFHWHLTEDQGWRIEITRYPRLTSVASHRSETVLEKNRNPYIGDGIPHGGFYTQDEVRDIVRYAADRFITVIPEIEMPGHSTAALAAYPELACTEGPFEVATTWGIMDDIYCPHERTFEFLEGVLTEVMDLFPSRYIHIGGDEAPKTRWEQSEAAQAVMRREGLADEHELQSWFIQRIERFLLAHDRRIIGWDEILEGGLAPEATVMSWRGTEGGIEAATMGHDVIMTPYSHVYFDYYQADSTAEPLAIGGFLPLETVYAFEPVPDALSPEEATHILGAQGNVWTEYIRTPEYLDYMVFPRMLALAEVVWSPRERRDLEGFRRRLESNLRLLEELGVNYRAP